MAIKDPKNAKHILKISLATKQITTKSNYVSVLRHWVKYCIEHDELPEPPFDIDVIMYWFSERALMLGNVSSICT